MKIKRKFRCRIEEVTVIGGFVYDSFLLDKKDFTDYSESEFSGSFADDYKKEMKEIDELIAPKNITRKMKVVTSHLYKTILLRSRSQFAYRAAQRFWNTNHAPSPR